MQKKNVYSFTNDLLQLLNLQLNHVVFYSNNPKQPTQPNIESGAADAEKNFQSAIRVFRPEYNRSDQGKKTECAAYTSTLKNAGTLFRGSAGSKVIEYYFTSLPNSSSQLDKITATDLKHPEKENLRKAFLETLRNIGKNNLINCHNCCSFLRELKKLLGA